MAKHPNPLEKEFLIRQFKSNRRIRLSDFCTANHVSDAAFRKWLQQYNEGGIEGLARADMEIREVLPEGIDRTEEVYKREILKLISHTPSEGVGISGISHTPLEGVEKQRCLHMLCRAVFRLPSPLTPSEGVGISRISHTPSEGVEKQRCLHMLCRAVFPLQSPFTPSEGVGISRIFHTPSEGVE